MQSWSWFAEKQKQKLMIAKDYVCLPLVKCLSNKITPNSLTCLRILMAFGLYLLLIAEVRYLFWWAVVLYILAKFTDMIDGCLARYRNQTSLLGEFIDILADKFFYLIGFFVLVNLWPQVIAFHFIFLVMSVSITIVILNNIKIIFEEKVREILRLARRLFEGLGYFTAIILLIIQLGFF